ncbi:MAG: hypothetical protein ACJ709_03135 [Nitrososphaeraceae archaeon]|jgi:hypothetical protein
MGSQAYVKALGTLQRSMEIQKDVNKFYQDRAPINSGLQYFTVAISVSVIASIIGMVLVFVIKDRFKALGIVLALRYKPKPSMKLTK